MSLNYNNANVKSYKKSGATAHLIDRAGSFSPAGATAPTTHPADFGAGDTHSCAAALNSPTNSTPIPMRPFNSPARFQGGARETMKNTTPLFLFLALTGTAHAQMTASRLFLAPSDTTPVHKLLSFTSVRR